MTIITKRPWTRQPQIVTPVSALAADAFVWTPITPGFAIVNGSHKAGTQVNPVPGASNGMRHVSWTNGADATTGLNFPSYQFIPANISGLTILVLAAPTAEAAFRFAFSQKLAGFFTPQIGLGFNAGTGLSIESGSINLFHRDTNAFSYNIRAQSQIDGGLHCWVFGASTSSANNSLHRDGVPQTLATNDALTGGPYFSDTTTTTTVGNLYAADFGTRFSYPLYLLAVWPRLLPLPVRQRLSANPWQVFAPLTRRIWVPAAAGSGALTGTAELTFGAGTSTLSGTGALIGTAPVLFSAGASTLTGLASVSGITALVFGSGASTLTGIGALASAATLTFGSGVSTLTGAGALSGTSALTFGAGTTVLAGSGLLAGAAALTFGVSATAALEGSITGTSVLTFGSGVSALNGQGALLGTTAFAFSAGASALTGQGALAGSAAAAFTASGTLVLPGALTGNVSIAFANTGLLEGTAALAGQASVQFLATATADQPSSGIQVGYGNLSFGDLPRPRKRRFELEGLRTELEEALAPPPKAVGAPVPWKPLEFSPELAGALIAVRQAATKQPTQEVAALRKAITLAHEAQQAYQRKVRRQKQQRYLLLEL